MFFDDGFRSNVLAQVCRYSHIAKDMQPEQQQHHHLPHHHHHHHPPPGLGGRSSPPAPSPVGVGVGMPTPPAPYVAGSEHPSPPPPPPTHHHCAGDDGIAEATGGSCARQLHSDSLLSRIDNFELRANAYDYNVVRRKRAAELASELRALQHDLDAGQMLVDDPHLLSQEVGRLKATLKDTFFRQLEGAHTGLRDVTSLFREKELQIVRAMHASRHSPRDGSPGLGLPRFRLSNSPSSHRAEEQCLVCADSPEGSEDTYNVLEVELDRVAARLASVKSDQQAYVEQMHAELRVLHVQIDEVKDARKKSEEDFVGLVEAVVGKLADELKEERQKRMTLFRTVRQTIKRRHPARPAAHGRRERPAVQRGRSTSQKGPRSRAASGGAPVVVPVASAAVGRPAASQQSRHRSPSPPGEKDMFGGGGGGGETRLVSPERPGAGDGAPERADLSPTPTTLRVAPASLFHHLFQPHPSTPLGAQHRGTAPVGQSGGRTPRSSLRGGGGRALDPLSSNVTHGTHPPHRAKVVQVRSASGARGGVQGVPGGGISRAESDGKPKWR